MKGLYIYCITINNQLGFTRQGVNFGRDPFVLIYRDIAMVASALENNFRSKENLHEKLVQNLSWTMKNINLHHGLIDHISRHQTVIPMKFGIILPSRRDAHKILADFYADFKKLLEELSNREEWGVKIYAESKNPAIVFRKKEEVKVTHYSPFSWRTFQEKAEEEKIKEKMEEAIANELDRIIVTLKLNSEKLVMNELLPREFNRRQREMIMNGSFLVNKKDTAGFIDILDKIKISLKNYGLLAEISGPWPPYSFTEIKREINYF